MREIIMKEKIKAPLMYLATAIVVVSFCLYFFPKWTFENKVIFTTIFIVLPFIYWLLIK